MNAEPNDIDENAGVDVSTEVLVQPGTSAFFYQNSALKVQSMSNDGIVECEVMQSSNNALVLGTVVQFQDLDNVKSMIRNTLNL